jgi:D-alanyl-D-alanine dipeptidase
MKTILISRILITIRVAVYINKSNRLLLATLLTLLVLCIILVYTQNKGGEVRASAPNSGSEIENIEDLIPTVNETLDVDQLQADESSINNSNDPVNTPQGTPAAPHEGFVYLSETLPNAKFDVRYATSHNFTGQIVEGYLTDKISISVKAAEALKKVSDILEKQGYGLLIYDSYRPKRAVDSFIEWGNQPESNDTKAEFYPDFEKSQLFKLGYLAKRSAHSRGSTVDLTIFDMNTGEPLDMGSPYDFLGPISNHGSKLISETQTKNRNILKDAMKAAGFKELRTEWWHYELINEPFPKTYFDFVIK